MTRLAIYILFIISLFLFSCKDKAPSKSPFFGKQDLIVMGQRVNVALQEVKELKQQITSFHSEDSTRNDLYALDGESISYDEFIDAKEEIVYASTSYFPTDKMVVVNSPDKDSNEKMYMPEMIWNIQGVTERYFEERFFTPEHMLLQRDDNDILGLTLGSTYTGPMNAVAFNKATGEKVTSWNNQKYDGSYYLGFNIANKKFEELRLVVIVGDSLSYSDFKAENL